MMLILPPTLSEMKAGRDLRSRYFLIGAGGEGTEIPPLVTLSFDDEDSAQGDKTDPQNEQDKKPLCVAHTSVP